MLDTFKIAFITFLPELYGEVVDGGFFTKGYLSSDTVEVASECLRLIMLTHGIQSACNLPSIKVRMLKQVSFNILLSQKAGWQDVSGTSKSLEPK